MNEFLLICLAIQKAFLTKIMSESLKRKSKSYLISIQFYLEGFVSKASEILITAALAFNIMSDFLGRNQSVKDWNPNH